MSVFKKLAGLLFEEADAEVLAEDELEPIEIKEKPKKATASPVVEEEKTHVQMAQKYPDIAWVGVEKNINVAALAVRKYTQLEQQPDNMLYIQGDAEVIDTWFAQGEVDVIHLNFSDPWPKKRAHKKRLSNHAFIARYAHILKPDGEIQMKTDNSALFEYSLMEFQEEGWRLKEVSVDYRREEHAEDVITEYERRFLEKGQPIYRAVFVKNGKEKDAPFPEK